MTEPVMPTLTRSQVLICMAVSAVVMLVVAKTWTFLFDARVISLSWQPIHLAWGIGLGLLVTLLSSLIYEIWADYRLAANTYLEMVLKPLELVDVIWLGILPGMSEELLFRGVVLPSFGMNAVGLIVSSLIFGILHMASLKHWQYAAWAVIVGIGLGLVTIATDSLLPAVTTHIFTNSLSGLIWKLKQQKLSDL
ncbi:CAAX amino terminal protease family [Synechococcus sp. PCC 7502]|uniref:CPBP family intramembrane glutamic endopeptidase n=1 Tax=Synechococcus sp. PCC 7502 TaxID=1173263 RepID=UPI00029FD399|nr:CPBP family intramembrane glutamic endopeptidase [Synechococcus sp. PCC 7502]AFY73086.1 CAAX amino terminal protease family [Synechococcus sp. PCC 7502]